VGPLAIRRATRRFRRHGVALFAVVAIGCAIAIHHGAPPTDAMHHDGALSTIVDLCAGVVVAVGSAAAAVAIGLISLGRWRPRADMRPVGLSRALAWHQPRARAGPLLLSLVCVARR
jgi:hypothetical protein